MRRKLTSSYTMRTMSESHCRHCGDIKKFEMRARRGIDPRVYGTVGSPPPRQARLQWLTVNVKRQTHRIDTTGIGLQLTCHHPGVVWLCRGKG
jgi:hypothetical protein